MTGRVDPLLDEAPCGFLSFADDGTVTAANATLHEMLGFGAGELAGANVENVLTLASRIFYQTHFFPVLRLHGRADEIFLVLRTRDGRDVGALVNARRRERDGRPANDCVVMEVRERRKFEDELVRARRAADDARATVEAREAELQRANELLSGQALELELQQQQMEEQAVELEHAANDLRNGNDVLVARSEELDRQRALAEQANRAKSEFLTTMSHELRTPLNAIGGYAELLALEIYGPVTARQQDALARLQRSQRHLLGLINDILNLARIEAGRVEYTISEVALADVVADVLPMIEPQLDAKSITLAANVAPDHRARADREKLEQILINLLTNAVKFTPAGGSVTVDSFADRGADGRVFLRVADTGIGIPPDKLESVFAPFVQVNASLTRTEEGTGLGLAISRDLARGMGGDLRARSIERRGSTFTITLPG